MKTGEKVFLVVAVLWFIAVAYGLGLQQHRGDYYRGQIDALNGDVKYELRHTTDGEVRWFEKGAK